MNGHTISHMTSPTARPIEPVYPALPTGSPHEVLVLPRELDDAGVPRYHDTAVDLVKALKFEGLDASYLHGAEERRWLGEKSHLQYALDVVIAIFSAGAYDGIKRLLRRRHDSHSVRLRVTRQSSDGAWEWYELEGTGEDVSSALNELNQSPQDPELPE